MEKHVEKKFRKQLRSENSLEVIAAIKYLREVGNEMFINDLAILLCETKSEDIHSLILNLFNDLKNKNAVPELVSVLKNKSYEKEKSNIISACWKSGLNFSSELDIFFEIFCLDDFVSAFEAYTVLETNIPYLTPEAANKYLSFLLKKEKGLDPDRLELANYLKSMLQE